MRKISYACPVCNGFSALSILFPKCTTPLMDYGRFSDLLGDYSPYRPIDDLKMTDGWIDVATHRCPHHLFCPACGFSDVEMVSEIEI
ncbi:hypothetical protein H1164_04070 [Thermoactinomyces daqus]|uniref:Uncharacterized protein n=1 Tax=Thermoactinomyces daqus TaxID=1329516 RepID=A0A7W1X8R2_9BACL|nr:hypothetical protein [Thermoactinomyces daqus]MBA4542077.1 hypothetical protein [Thermoactinomyces daqus]